MSLTLGEEVRFQKVLSSGVKQSLEQQLSSILKTSNMYVDEISPIGVLGGQSGVAMLQFYGARYFDNDSYSDFGVEIINKIIGRINNGYSFPTYCNGVAGFGWVLQHLVNQEFIDLDLDDLLFPFDDYLLNQMRYEFSKEHYDILHGGMGYGMYFLKRFCGLNTSEESKNRFREYLVELLSHLEETSIHEKKGIKWQSILDIEKGNKVFNLSLSHGMSSIIYILKKLFDNNIERERVLQLLEGAINYIGQFQKDEEGYVSLFPSWVEPKQSLEYKSRLAWCYGDIGIGLAFGWSSDILKSKELQERALDILLRSSARNSPESAMVVDSGYCHGSFGNAHLFNKLTMQYGLDEFKKARLFWLEDGLSRQNNNIEKPYFQWDGRSNSWLFKLNLLEGIVGIGLSMIDFLSVEETTWDECLMLR